jgi:serine/threonine protein kinase
MASGGACDDATPSSPTQSVACDSTISDQQIGRYRLMRKIGEGSFGIVYLAYDEELQRTVAFKVPTSERFQQLVDADTYLNEARTAASLDHPNIVPVYDLGRTDDGSIYCFQIHRGSDVGRPN